MPLALLYEDGGREKNYERSFERPFDGEFSLSVLLVGTCEEKTETVEKNHFSALVFGIFERIFPSFSENWGKEEVTVTPSRGN